MATAIPIYVKTGGCGRFDVVAEVRQHLDRLFGYEEGAYMIGAEAPHWHPIGRQDIDMHIVTLQDKEGLGHTVFFRLTAESRPVVPIRIESTPAAAVSEVRPVTATVTGHWMGEELSAPVGNNNTQSVMPDIGINLSDSVESTTILIKQKLANEEMAKHEDMDEETDHPKKKEKKGRKKADK